MITINNHVVSDCSKNISYMTVFIVKKNGLKYLSNLNSLRTYVFITVVSCGDKKAAVLDLKDEKVIKAIQVVGDKNTTLNNDLILQSFNDANGVSLSLDDVTISTPAPVSDPNSLTFTADITSKGGSKLAKGGTITLTITITTQTDLTTLVKDLSIESNNLTTQASIHEVFLALKVANPDITFLESDIVFDHSTVVQNAKYEQFIKSADHKIAVTGSIDLNITLTASKS